MPGRKNIWITDESRQHLEELSAHWRLSDSATIRRALHLAYLRPRTDSKGD